MITATGLGRARPGKSELLSYSEWLKQNKDNISQEYVAYPIEYVEYLHSYIEDLELALINEGLM